LKDSGKDTNRYLGRIHHSSLSFRLFGELHLGFKNYMAARISLIHIHSELMGQIHHLQKLPNSAPLVSPAAAAAAGK